MVTISEAIKDLMKIYVRYAYGPVGGLPNTKVGAFTQALYDEAKKQGWTVISMKTDWKRIFAYEP